MGAAWDEGMDQGLQSKRARYCQDLADSLKRAVSLLSSLPEVRRVSLVGSYARGRRDLFTDLDFLIVMETRDSVVERLRRLYSLLHLPVDYDLLCYTPAELEQERGRGFLRQVQKDEILLYEK